ncbi:sphingosine-1-phosphate lyase-like [Penaeus indicus]|uniref:sphingosine-1-phosphate lyase-like n=1 Tax=Penaeus indicus TaxID=29960 RepID=UPI00300D6888
MASILAAMTRFANLTKPMRYMVTGLVVCASDTGHLTSRRMWPRSAYSCDRDGWHRKVFPTIATWKGLGRYNKEHPGLLIMAALQVRKQIHFLCDRKVWLLHTAQGLTFGCSTDKGQVVFEAVSPKTCAVAVRTHSPTTPLPSFTGVKAFSKQAILTRFISSTAGLSYLAMENLKLGLTGVEAALERWTEGREKWQVVAGSATLTLAAMALGNLYANRADVKDDLQAWVFRVLRSVPAIKSYIQKQLDQSRKEIQKGIFEDAGASVAALPPLKELPKDGWSEERVLDVAANTLGKGNYAWQDGKISGGAFSGGNEDLSDVLLKVYGMTALTNPLHADMFPGVRKMEAEIVRMTLSIFHGDDEACGCMTSGGSESLLMAMKAMRDWGREVKGVKRAEVVMAVTGHSGFDKAASLLGVKIRKVPVDPVSFKADVNAMRRAINRNTVMLVASAPEFPHGIIDDVEAIGALGLARGVPVHVDCCMGGFLMPFMDAAGFPLPPFDFRVPGVVSISADTHKPAAQCRASRPRAGPRVITGGAASQASMAPPIPNPARVPNLRSNHGVPSVIQDRMNYIFILHRLAD